MGAEEKQAVMEVMDSDVLSAFLGAAGPHFLGGKKVRALEADWSGLCGGSHAISVNSWTSGLCAAVGALGLGPGDEMIVPPYTMSASATCALFYGVVPVFADIDPVHFCIDPESIRKKISPRTKAIMVVHLFGHPAPMDAIMQVAAEYKLKVIEDAAQAPGVIWKDRPVGTWGDIGGFSFNFHKHIHTGEGGMLITSCEDLARRCQWIRNHGENAVDYEEVENLANVIGGNYRLTELQAAIGIAQLRKLPAILDTRQRLASHLRSRLNGLPGLSPQPKIEQGTHAYYVFPIKLDAETAGISRSNFVKAVKAELPVASGFETTPLTEGYVRPLYLSKIYQQRIAIGREGFPFNTVPADSIDYSKGSCPVTEAMYERELLLTPLVREPLVEKDLDDLANAITKVLENAPEIQYKLGESQEGIQTPVSVLNKSRLP
jgi:perosamine synthetase